MALFAARMNDPQLCLAHGPAPLPDGALNVRINSQPTVRVGDVFKCGGCPNRVQTGASTVTFGGEFAARATDQSDHGGRIVIGSANVVIGGPTGMGCIGAGKSACQAMAAGRKSASTQQSGGNCHPESLRQVIRRAKGNEIGEDEMLKEVINHHGAADSPNRRIHGGTACGEGTKILERFGIPAERKPADLASIKQAVQERRGIVAFFEVQDVWPPPNDPGFHATLITGVELDKDGNVTSVFMNDTGLGACGVKVPAQQLAIGMTKYGHQPLVVTKGAIW